MSKIADAIKKFLSEFLNKAIKFSLDFFSKPNILGLLTLAAFAILDPILQKLLEFIKSKLAELLSDAFGFGPAESITDDDIIKYVKSNKELRQITRAADNDLNNSLASEITMACEDPNYHSDNAENLRGKLNTNEGIDAATYFGIVQEENDYETTTDGYDLSGLQGILDGINGILPWVFLIYITIIGVKDLLTQNDFPSPHRSKFIQRRLRMVGSILKREVKNGNKSPEIKGLLKTISAVDTIIVGSLMAAFIYIGNRKDYQKSSKETLEEITSEVACGGIESELSDEETSINFDASTYNIDNGKDNVSSFNCPVEIEEPLVPHEPFEMKLLNNDLETCEIVQEADPSVGDVGLISDTADKAIIENKSDKEFKIVVNKTQSVDTRTLLGTLGGSRVYSPVEGTIISVEKNKITLGDINDAESGYIEELIEDIQSLYAEQTNLKLFLKDFYIDSWYPAMLSESPLNDEVITPEEIASYQYVAGGVLKRFEVAQERNKTANENYETGIQKVTGKDNVKEKSENLNLLGIKVEVDNLETLLFKTLEEIGATALIQASVTNGPDDEFTLIDYYFDLLQQLLANYEQTDVIIPFRDQISKFLTRRFFDDRWSKTDLEDKVNTLCDELAEGTFFEETPNFFQKMLEFTYNSASANMIEVENYIQSLGDENNEFTETVKQKIVDKVMFLFEFTLEVFQQIENNYSTDLNKIEITNIESNYIRNYFADQWKKYNEIPEKLKEINEELDNLGNTLILYSIVIIDDEQYRYYGIGQERECEIPTEEGDDYTSPFSKYQFSDIEYWLKYCAYATLASVTNPAQGWSTGIPPPIGPIPLPVIYIPIKAFQLNWGFIVIGITITGMYPFPWILFSNLSIGYHVPIADPATIIKREIQALKKILSGSVKVFKQKTLRSFLDQKKSEINILNVEITKLEREKSDLAANKPKRERKVAKYFKESTAKKTINDGVENIKKPAGEITEKTAEQIYYVKLTEWHAAKAAVRERLTVLKTQRFGLEILYDIAYISYSKGNKISKREAKLSAKMNSMYESEQQIDKQFVKLDKLVEKTELLVKPLPITTSPETANFAFTIKNPKPIIEFADDLNDNTNTSVLNPFVNNHRLKANDFMSGNFNNKKNNSFVNWDKYKKDLKALMPLIVIGDPFPKYENLKLTNVPWVAFLYTSWVPKGAQTYGFPGFNPVPIG